VLHELRAIPTWMAGHAKVFLLYETPFWRAAGLSGDGISRIGPLQEIHDASGPSPGYGALFGFVGLAATAPGRARDMLAADSVQQLQRMFGEAAAKPLDVLVQDWARDELTATAADAVTSSHPQYAMPAAVARLTQQGLIFASSEMAPHYGGFIEGALEASENAAILLESV
jgi:monoamine oxidase